MQTADTRLRLRLLLAVAGILGVAFVSAAVYLPRYPAFRARPLASEIAATEFRDPKDALALKKDLLQYETDNQIKIWTALAQALGAIVIAGGVYFTWRNLLIAQQNLRATELKLDVDRQGQITNRFTHAVGQLGAESKEGRPNLEVRLGGIYALERIAKDSPADYWMVMEILAAYTRENARWPPSSAPPASPAQPPKPRVDLQAILTVLGRGSPPANPPPHFMLDLREADLRGAELWNSRLRHVDFWGAHLEEARFWGAVLRDVKLENAHLQGASFREARLAQVDFRGADLRSAEFFGADLRDAIHLTPGQIGAAFGDENTQLPDGLTRPAGWIAASPQS